MISISRAWEVPGHRVEDTEQLVSKEGPCPHAKLSEKSLGTMKESIFPIPIQQFSLSATDSI